MGNLSPFDHLASAARRMAFDMPAPTYRLDVQLPNGFWETQEAYPDLDTAADMLICARDDGLRARVFEAHYDGQAVNVTAKAEATIRAWLDLRGDDYPDWMAQ